MDDIIKARNAILEDLKRRGKEGDKTVKANPRWSTPYGEEDNGTNCWSGQGRILCPVCNYGALLYSRSSYNGHVHARCTKDGCVMWVE